MPRPPSEGDYSNVATAAEVMALDIIQTYNDRLPFHNDDHTRRVHRRTMALLDAMEITSPKVRCLGAVAALFHDTVQSYSPGINEARSAALAAGFIDSVNEYAPRENLLPPFDYSDRELVTSAITATVARSTADRCTVFQPNLYPASHPVVRALALADLGCAGMDGPTQFQKDGDALFRELHPEVLKIAGESPVRPGFAGAGGRTEAMENECLWTMRRWLEGQIQFAEGRQRRPYELKGLPETARSNVEALFCYFDATIAAAKERIAAVADTNFFQLGSAMGFLVV